MANSKSIVSALNMIRTTNTVGLSVLRILLGAGFAALGIWFVVNMHDFTQVVPGRSLFPIGGFLLAHAVVFTHVGGGAMLVLGFSTRAAAAVQLPILAGALTFVEPGAGVLALPDAFAIAFALVTVVVIFLGAGRFSLDHYLGTRVEIDVEGETSPVQL